MINRICEECGIEFRTHACYLKRGGGRFCSRKCSDTKDICSVEGCSNYVKLHNLCGKHYYRIRVHGTIEIENIGQSRKGSSNGMYGSKRIGELNPFYGKKHTDETKNKIRLKKVGEVRSEDFKAKVSATLKGRIITESHRIKISNSSKGRTVLPEIVEKTRIKNIGKKRTLEVRLKNSGANNKNWKGGITPINSKIRMSIEMREWRCSVYKRDNFTCVICGQVGKKLNADHIKPFALYPELRFELSNGRTLCVDCHKKTDTFAGKTKKPKINNHAKNRSITKAKNHL